MAKITSLPKNIEKRAIDYVKGRLKDGSSTYSIRRELLDKNYSSETADMLIQKAKKRFPILIFLIILIAAGVAALIYFLAPLIAPLISQIGTIFVSEKNCGSDSECFITAANLCQSAKFQNNIAGSVYEYKTKDCVLTKTALKINETEPQEIKDIFEGQSMTCEYSNGYFNENWLNTLSTDAELCEGGLKDAIDMIVSI